MVRFANTVCTANGNLDGTCYRRRQCSDIDGTASGTCASGIGTCCVSKFIAADLNISSNYKLVHSLIKKKLHSPLYFIYTFSQYLCQILENVYSVYRTCSESSSYNNTYFSNEGYPATVSSTTRCIMAIERCNSGICQVSFSTTKFT